MREFVRFAGFRGSGLPTTSGRRRRSLHFRQNSHDCARGGPEFRFADSPRSERRRRRRRGTLPATSADLNGCLVRWRARPPPRAASSRCRVRLSSKSAASYTAPAAGCGSAGPLTNCSSVLVSVRLSNGFTMKSVAPSLNASFRMFFCPSALTTTILALGSSAMISTQGVNAVVLGHHQIDGHGHGPKFGITLDGFLAVAGFADDFPAGAAGRLFDLLADDRGVVGDKQSFCHSDSSLIQMVRAGRPTHATVTCPVARSKQTRRPLLPPAS